MSLSEGDRKFRAGSRRSFPIDPSADTDAAFASVIADALRRDFGTSHGQVKHISRLTGSNGRTVQNWLQARNGPSGASLVVLMRHSDEVTTAVLTLADRDHLRRASELARGIAAVRAAVSSLLALLPDAPPDADDR